MNNVRIDYQHIYLYMDDSGKISRYEDYSVFAGIVFTNSKEKSEFTNKYRSIINDIKCKYCQFNKNCCNKNCPEIKASNIENTDRRRLMNLSKSFSTFGTVILNKNLHDDIIVHTASKGRFVEYAQRRIIKNTVQYLIDEKIIDPNKPIHLHVNIDEMPTKTNGYYTLREGIREEFLFGIKNFNYQKKFNPIVFADFKCDVIYRDSKFDYGIQMADIIANSIRKALILNPNYFETLKYLTNHLKINVILRLPN
ncbi:MAG: DUF3800 domain-containing protein [Solobacterium sp.]|nr:DUF3800 domain-containing protein [Solobacterium sp.]